MTARPATDRKSRVDGGSCRLPAAGCSARTWPLTQRVEDALHLAAGRPRPRRCCRRGGGDPLAQLRRPGCGGPRRVTHSTAAQRTSREPCLVIRPRRTWVPDSWCLGVSPAQHANWAASPKRVTSPTSATNTAARTGPIPGICWTAA